MKQILIGTSVAYTDATSPAGLTAGEVGVFSAKDNSLITAANVNDHKGHPFYLAGYSATGPRVTNPIHGIKELNYNDYVAPVKQVVTISSITKASVETKYTDYSIKVIDVTDGMSPSEGKLTSEVLGAYTNVAGLVDALVAKINGNKNSVVVASRSTNDLVLTAKEFLTNFRVSLGGNLESATITYTTPASVGIGYGPRVHKLEKDFLVYEGYRARLDTRYPVPPLQSSAGSNYDVLTMEGIYTANAKHGMDAMYNRNTLYIVAVVAGGAQFDTIATILDELNTRVGPQGDPGEDAT